MKADSGTGSGRPRVTVSVAVSLDGYMSTVSSKPLRISSERDLLEVHRLRAGSDAILVGAETLRQDNCQLTSRGGQRDSRQPARITLTRSGCIDYNAKFFALDGAKKMIFCPMSVASALQVELPQEAHVVAFAGESCPLPEILENLKVDGVNELMVEGGASVINQFLRGRLVDRVRIAIGPQVVGSTGKTRLFEPTSAAALSRDDWRFVSVENLGDTVVIWYELNDAATH